MEPGAVGSRAELYRISTDPRERRDVAADRPETVARLKGELRRWRDGLGPAATPTGRAELGNEDRRRLEALGYLGHTDNQ